MAIATSFGNKFLHTKACKNVETNRTETMVEATNESERAKPLVITEVSCSAYLIVAIDAVVIGKVYDHHATENLSKFIH